LEDIVNLSDLKMELENGSLAESTVSLIEEGRDGEIADLLNAPFDTLPGPISRSLFTLWAAETGLRAVIRDHALNVTSPLRSVALSLEDFLGGAAETLDFGNPKNRQMLAIWVQAGGCTQEQADDLLDQSKQSRSRAQQLFGESVTINQIATALRG
jgi:hypothetical protein